MLSLFSHLVYEMFKDAVKQKKYGWNLVPAFVLGSAHEFTSLSCCVKFNLLQVRVGEQR